MGNEIIIRYTWKRKEDGHIWQNIVPIECLEGKGDTPFMGNDLWDLVARDLYVGINDKNENKIFEGDYAKIHYFKMALGDGLGVCETDVTIEGYFANDGLSLALMEIAGKEWEEYTGYEPSEGSCKVFHLHDVFDDSTNFEWHIELTGGNIHDPK